MLKEPTPIAEGKLTRNKSLIPDSPPDSGAIQQTVDTDVSFNSKDLSHDAHDWVQTKSIV